MPADMTTVKVSKPLRQRISRHAAREGLTSADLIARLLDVRERELRFKAVRDAYAKPDSRYETETEAWDSLADDGLTD